MIASTLSIIMPVFNEEKTVTVIIDKIKDVKLIKGIEKELIVVDDHSSDNTFQNLQEYIKDNADMEIKLLSHQKNMGKGAAIHTGIKAATGTYIVIQDADLEYDPQEYNLLLKPIVDGFADVVYGSRFRGGNAHRVLFYFHTVGNKFLTFLSNILTGINITDMETCYKLFKSEILKGIDFKEKRFGFEPEVTAKIARIKNIRVYEVGISYYGRTYQEGKKINWKDGFRALYCILKYNLFK